MRGRKPKPSHLHLITGTAAKSAGADSPVRTPGPRPPTCPAHLGPTAKAEWKRLAQALFDEAVLAHGDRATLAAYCQAYGRWVEAERKLAATPMLIKLPSGYIQPSPWLAISNKSLELMAKFAAELGLSPVSRSRVAPARSLHPPPWEFD